MSEFQFTSGQFYSIIGDSISTLRGYHPAFCKAFYMQHPESMCSGIARPSDTWWAKVIRHFDGVVCNNNSYSGSLVSGLIFPSATQQLRWGELHCNQGDYYYSLIKGKAGRTICTETVNPDVILIFMGTNDWLSNAPIGDLNRFNFDYSYAYMLEKVRKRYPDARVICGTLFQDNNQAPNATYPISFYNRIIRKCAAEAGCDIAELAGSGREIETIDGIHPTYQGMQVLSELWIKSMENLK